MKTASLYHSANLIIICVYVASSYVTSLLNPLFHLCIACTTYITLENVEHCGDEPEQADRILMSG